MVFQRTYSHISLYIVFPSSFSLSIVSQWNSEPKHIGRLSYKIKCPIWTPPFFFCSFLQSAFFLHFQLSFCRILNLNKMAFSKILSCVYSIVSVLSLSILSLFPQYYQHVELTYFSCFLNGQKTTLCFLWNFRLTLERRVTHPLSFSCTHYVRIET